MDYKNINLFGEYVKENILSYLPEDYEGADVSIHEIEKSGTTLLGITVKKQDSCIAPNVYLEGFYKRYQEGNDVLQDIADMIVKYQPEGFEVKDLTELLSRENVLKTVVPKLVPIKNNEAYLNDKVYVKYLDMAEIFQVPVGNPIPDDNGFACVTLDNKNIEVCNVTVEELEKAAKENIRKDFVLLPMKDMLIAMGYPEEMLEVMADACPMKILSNESKINGANQLLNEDALKAVALKMGDTFVVIPSSIHECIILPYDDTMEPEQINDIICDVNATQVRPDEVLGDHYYIYRDGQLQVA